MKYKGSYTVEAACLLPLILGVIVMLIYLGLYLHDRTILSETAYMAALKGSFLENASNSEIEHEMHSECENVLENNQFVLNNKNIKVTAESQSVSVTLSGQMEYPTLGVLRYIGVSGVLNVTAKENLKRINPVDTIRLYRIAEGVVEE